MVSSCVLVADAEPLMTGDVECNPNCVLHSAPGLGQSIVINSIKTASTSKVELLLSSSGWKPCKLPCLVVWRGVESLRVRATDLRGAALTFPVTQEPPGAVTIATGDHGDAAGSKVDLASLGLSGDMEGQTFKIFGPDTQLVPEKITGPSAQIINGQTVSLNSDSSSSLDRFFDDVVLLSSKTLTCTGIVVGRRSILTAKHCSSVSTVRLAKRDKTINVAIESVELNPRSDVDVVLLVTRADLDIGTRLRAKSKSNTTAAGLIKLVGYGTTDTQGASGAGIKRQATVAVDNWECTPTRATKTGCIPGEELVIAGPTSDTCSGDSGGPVLEKVGAEWRLAGVTSRSIPGNRSVCGGGGIYTSVGAIADWLDERVR